MPVKIPAQRATLISSINGLVATPWWQFFSDIANFINGSRFSSSGTASAVTGTVAETVAATIPVAIGNGGAMRLSLALSSTNNANAKTAIIKIGTTTIQTYIIDPSTDTQTAQIFLVGRGASDQYTTTLPSVNCIGSGGIATAIDLSSRVNVTISFELASASDTVTLESWLLEVEQT